MFNALLKHTLIIGAIALILSLSQTVNAQIYQKGSVNIGIDGGIQFTNVSTNFTSNSPSSGTGFSIGPYVEYHVSNNFKLRLGAQYDNRAFGINESAIWRAVCEDSLFIYENSYIQYKRDYKVNYLTLPLSIIYVKGNEKFKIYVQLSFYYSIYLSAHQKGFNDLYIDTLDFQNICDTTISVGHNIKEFDEAVERGFNTSDFGLNFYIGGIIKLAPGLGLTIAPGFTWGMGDVFEDQSIMSNWSRIFKINTGIVYTFKKKQNASKPATQYR